MDEARPVTVLIAALGGEGGGVLTNWLVAAAAAQDLPVQSTSIPGVAQRTGATTYYIEIVPVPRARLGGRNPVLALTPAAGEVDLMAASELLEAARAVANGFVSPERTTLVASTHRIFAMAEKTAMGDGRLDAGRLLQAVEEAAQATLLFDMAAEAEAVKAPLNAVLMGAMLGSGKLPLDPAACEAAIRAEGKSVEANVAGFRAGLAAARRAAPRPAPGASLAAFPASAQEVVAEGARRLTAYQDAAYAQLYLDRLAPLREGEERLLRETARHLALRMSFEDVIRVAEAKIAPERWQRIRAEIGARPEEPVAIVDFFKPGIEELCSLLPPRLARPILHLAERRGWLNRLYWGMELKSTTILGYLRLRLLAGLKPWRRRSYRFLEEQAAIEEWLGLIRAAAPRSPALALEIAECARLIKGYGETHRRGTANFAAIVERIIRPTLAGHLMADTAADALASARTAALADPEGDSLARTLAEIEARTALPVAAQ